MDSEGIEGFVIDLTSELLSDALEPGVQRGMAQEVQLAALPGRVGRTPTTTRYALVGVGDVQTALAIAEATARALMLDRDGLIADIERPRWHAHYRNADAIDQGAVLAEGLVGNHAWADGNKRTTWAAFRTFLDVKASSGVRRPRSMMLSCR